MEMMIQYRPWYLNVETLKNCSEKSMTWPAQEIDIEQIIIHDNIISHLKMNFKIHTPIRVAKIENSLTIVLIKDNRKNLNLSHYYWDTLHIASLLKQSALKLIHITIARNHTLEKWELMCSHKNLYINLYPLKVVNTTPIDSSNRAEQVLITPDNGIYQSDLENPPAVTHWHCCCSISEGHSRQRNHSAQISFGPNAVGNPEQPYL